ncbi:MAG: FRG domain-containing protein [Verrucomicrobiales bacterium]|nr:FRG domain-containing protein [Verrucomicrobiales bacterium]
MSGWDVVRDFMDVLRDKGRRAAIYRGQPNAVWKLVPSAFRPDTRGILSEQSLHLWKTDAARFASPMPVDEIEWLVLAQHYGVATPLLDWTTSPLVALYFACADANQRESNGSIWRAMRSDFDEAKYTLMIQPFAEYPDRDKPFLINAIGRNARSTAQESLMSLHSKSDCNCVPGKVIFTVPCDVKYDTLQTMEKLGFTADRLHHDITMLVDRYKANMSGTRFPGWS